MSPIELNQSLQDKLSAVYELKQELGRGGMGVVYLAEDRRLGREVAIKVLSLKQSDALQAEHLLARFQQEARAVAQLNHPHIVTLYDLGEHDQQAYMIMEYSQGKALSEFALKQKNLAPALVASIGQQILHALAYAHERGIVHRDIKPANILLNQKGIAKLMDFGIARLQGDQRGLTQAGTIMGSVLYASPEQLQDSHDITGLSDIYGLGVTLYELLTGESPYRYQGEQLGTLLLEILSDQPFIPLQQKRADIPSVLADLIGQMLTKQVQDRPSAAQLLQAFARLGLNTTAPLSLELNLTIAESPLKRTRINLSQHENIRIDPRWILGLIHSWPQTVLSTLNVSAVLNNLLTPPLVGAGSNGILAIDQRWLLFISDAYLCGIYDLEGTHAEFADLPVQAQALTYYEADTDRAMVWILANLTRESGLLVQDKMDTSLINVWALLEDMSQDDPNFTAYLVCTLPEKRYYMGWNQGKQCFLYEASGTNTTPPLDSRALLQQTQALVSIYRCQQDLVGPSLQQLLHQCTATVTKKSAEAADLQTLLNNNDSEWPVHLVQEAKQNVYLDLDTSKMETRVLGGTPLSPEQHVYNSLQWRFAQWYLERCFYLLQSSGNSVSLKYFHSWIAAAQSFAFSQTLKGQTGQNHFFDLLIRGQVPGEAPNKLLHLVRSGQGNQTDVAHFLEAAIDVKKQLIKTGDIGAAIFVSHSDYERAALELFYARTVEPRKGLGLGSLDKLTRYKGFVRIGLNRGFHLILIQASPEQFQIIAPTLQ